MYTKIRGVSFFTAIIIICIVFGVGFFTGRRNATKITSNTPFDTAIVTHADSGGRVDFKLFWDAWDILKRRYVDHDTLDANTLLYGAINGMFRATGDPYTTFLDPEQNTEFEEDLDGNFDGIGAEIGIREHLLTIITPLVDSPAERAGLRAGDHIIMIDGLLTADMNIMEAVKNMRGESGTEVTLTVFRSGENDTRDITVVRGNIRVDSVSLEFPTETIAYLQVRQFGNDTARDFEEALHEVAQKKTQGIIIDMRNNPGGFLHVSVDMIGAFVPKQSVALIEKGSDNVEVRKKTHGQGPFVDTPVVILINEGSASASEIFAAALHVHHKDTTIIGRKSFGKGSVQELVSMKGGTAAKVSIARWLTPDGVQIEGEGIAPDIDVEYTVEDYEADRDPQRARAMEVMYEKINQ